MLADRFKTVDLNIPLVTLRYTRIINEAMSADPRGEALNEEIAGKTVAEYIRAAACAIPLGEKTGVCNVLIGKKAQIVAIAKVNSSQLEVMSGHEVELNTSSGIVFTVGLYSSSENHVFVAASWCQEDSNTYGNVVLRKMGTDVFVTDGRRMALS